MFGNPVKWRDCLASGVCFNSFAHIMGVSVSDTMAETRIVTARVTANSRKSRPTMSPMKSSNQDGDQGNSE